MIAGIFVTLIPDTSLSISHTCARYSLDHILPKKPIGKKRSVFDLKFWEQERNGKSRVCIWMEVDNGDNYFVILDVRKTFVLIWTAFFADYPHQAKKKQKEYEVWLASKGGIMMTPDELIADIQSRLSS